MERKQFLQKVLVLRTSMTTMEQLPVMGTTILTTNSFLLKFIEIGRIKITIEIQMSQLLLKVEFHLLDLERILVILKLGIHIDLVQYMEELKEHVMLHVLVSATSHVITSALNLVLLLAGLVVVTHVQQLVVTHVQAVLQCAILPARQNVRIALAMPV